MRVVLDSTVLFSIFYERDKWHQESMGIFSQFMTKKIEAIIPTLAPPEVCGAMRRETGNYKLAEIVESQLRSWMENGILSAKELTMDRMNYAVESAIKYSLKGSDSVFVSLTEESDAELATFDEDIIKKISGKVRLFNTKEQA